LSSATAATTHSARGAASLADALAPQQPALEIEALSHRFGDRVAVNGLTLSLAPREIVALLGPNGSGKSTTFRVLSTLAALQEGTVRVFGHDVGTAPDTVRRYLGVVFQNPSLDGKLTIAENLHHQGRLYGMPGDELRHRAAELLERLRLTDRARDRVEKLSGGLRRRAEIAKSLLHDPRLLLLDEPSTGLDPGARRDLWETLAGLRERDGVTILVTTHLMDEAERCDRVALMDQGRLVALDTPDALKAEIGGDVLTVRAATGEPLDALGEAIATTFAGELNEPPRMVDHDALQIDIAEGHRFITRLIEAFPGRIGQVSLGKPTLEDVFLVKTGHRLVTAPSEDSTTAAGAKKKRGR
jgi:ABC-2 type transport system ATP-binding protein